MRWIQASDHRQTIDEGDEIETLGLSTFNRKSKLKFGMESNLKQWAMTTTMVYTVGEERGTLKKESIDDDNNGGGLSGAPKS